MKLRLRSDERGSAISEFVIIAPFLFFLLVMTFDVSRAVNQYFSMLNSARGAVKLGAKIPGLEVSPGGTPCESPTGGGHLCATTTHLAIHDRANMLLGIESTSAEPTIFSSVITNDTNPITDVGILQFDIARNYRPILRMIIPSIPLRVQVVSPYLMG